MRIATEHQESVPMMLTTQAWASFGVPAHVPVSFTVSAAAPQRVSYLIGKLVLEVAWDEDQYVAVEPISGLFGEGDDVEEAVVDLIASIRTLWRQLAGERDNLSEHMERQFRTLSLAFAV